MAFQFTAKHIHSMCPGTCYRHKQLTLSEALVSTVITYAVYTGYCIDCELNFAIEIQPRVHDITDDWSYIVEDRKARQIVDDLKAIGETQMAEVVAEKMLRFRLLNQK